MTTAANHDINIKCLEKVQRALKPRDPELKDLRPANDRKMIILFVVPDALGKTSGAQKITGKAKAEHSMVCEDCAVRIRRTVQVLCTNGNVKYTPVLDGGGTFGTRL